MLSSIKSWFNLQRLEAIGFGFLIALLIINQIVVFKLYAKMSDKTSQVKFGHELITTMKNIVVSSDAPLYAKELNINFSNASEINRANVILGEMAPFQGEKPIALDDNELKRYIAIGTEPLITCEFCCGVKVLVRPDGKPSCGCAHSQAMRGVAAYIIKNHPDKTNEEISYELVRLKGLYFPTIMVKRAVTEFATKQYTNDIKYLRNKLSSDELEKLESLAKKAGTAIVPEKKQDEMVGNC